MDIKDLFVMVYDVISRSSVDISSYNFFVGASYIDIVPSSGSIGLVVLRALFALDVSGYVGFNDNNTFCLRLYPNE